MKRHLKIVISFILTLVLMMTFAGCQKKEDAKKTGFSLYYINKENTKLLSRKYNLKNADTLDNINELIQKMSDKKDARSVIPDGVTVNGVSLTDGIVTVNFGEDYQNMTIQREVLCRAGVVLTLSQLEDVEYVAFTINSQPYVKNDGNLAGAMKASDFVADLGSGDNDFAKADFVLYFANEQGTKLKEYKLTDAGYGEKTKEQFIIEQLINGPHKDGYMATLSGKLKLISVVTANNICYVDFAQNFNTELSNVSNKLVIYSIVNSLSELNDIHKVQISINGDSTVKYHGEISLEQPFIRNLDLIELKK